MKQYCEVKLLESVICYKLLSETQYFGLEKKNHYKPVFNYGAGKIVKIC